MRLRLLTAASMTLALLSGSAVARANGPSHAFSTLDYTHAKKSGSMTFLPLLSSDATYREGIAFYTSYFNEVQTPVVWTSTLKSVEVFVLPTVHKGTAEAYNSFFDGTTLVDKQEWWFSSPSPCSLSPAMDRFTAGLAPELQPSISTGGYPTACSVRLYYRTAQESDLFALLNANLGIVVNDTLPFCTSSSPVFATKPVVDALVSERALRDDGSGVLVGLYNSVFRALRQVKKRSPTLLGGASASSGESVFLRDAFDVTDMSATLLDGYAEAGTRMTACIPAPFTILYGTGN